jgi:hypothetical protein
MAVFLCKVLAMENDDVPECDNEGNNEKIVVQLDPPPPEALDLILSGGEDHGGVVETLRHTLSLPPEDDHADPLWVPEAQWHRSLLGEFRKVWEPIANALDLNSAVQSIDFLSKWPNLSCLLLYANLLIRYLT